MLTVRWFVHLTMKRKTFLYLYYFQQKSHTAKSNHVYSFIIISDNTVYNRTCFHYLNL